MADTSSLQKFTVARSDPSTGKTEACRWAFPHYQLIISWKCDPGRADPLRNTPKQEMCQGKVTRNSECQRCMGSGCFMTPDLPVTGTLATHLQPMLNFIGSEQSNTESSLARFPNRETESAQPAVVKKAVILGRNKMLHEKGSRCHWLQSLQLEFVCLFVLALCTNMRVSKVKKT